MKVCFAGAFDEIKAGFGVAEVGQPNHWERIPSLPPANCSGVHAKYDLNNCSGQPDFNKDGKSDFILYRPSDGKFYVRDLANGTTYTTVACGTANSIPRIVKDSNGNQNLLVTEPSTGVRKIATNTSCTNSTTVPQTGFTQAGYGYFSKFSVNIQAAWYYTNSTGMWYVPYPGTVDPFLHPNFLVPNNFTLGGTGFTALVDDYDGDMYVDPIVYNKTTGEWRVRQSSTGTVITFTYNAGANLVPVPMDLDGDARLDVTTYNTSTGTWSTQLLTTKGYGASLTWGGGAVVANADYDGDGYENYGVFYPSLGSFYYRKRDGTQVLTTFGTTGDIPVLDK